MSRKIIAMMITTLLLSFMLTGCGQNAATTTPPAKAKAIRVGSETTYMPFEFQDEKSKEYTGFDIELMKAIGKQMGTEIQFTSMNFDGLIPALEAGNVDVLISALTITPERATKVTFSDPYYKSGLSILVRADEKNIKGLKDLEGKKIGVQIGTSGADEAKKIPGAIIREFNTVDQHNMELKAKGVDAVINDLPVHEYYITKNGAADAKIVGDVLNSEDFGIAITKKDPELAKKINKALAELKANGEYEKIYVKWFGKASKK